MNYDLFIKKTKMKLVVMSISMLLPIIIVIVMAVGNWPISENSIFANAPAVPYVLCVAMLGWLIFKNGRYILILKNEKYAKKRFIQKTDERNKFINMNADALTLKIFLYALGVVTIFCAFIHYNYFWACLSVFVIFIVIHTIVRIYYNSKY